MKYHLRALKNGQCEVKDYITFGDRWSEETHVFYLYIWLIEGGPKPMLVDTGPKDIEAFNKATASYIPVGVTQAPDETTLGALEKAGIDPKDVSHVFITHTHPDHFENHDLFPNAVIVVNRNAYEDGVDSAPVGLRDRLLLAGDEQIVPGVSVFPVGAHSRDSQGIVVDTAEGRVVLSGDAAYLFENLEKDRPIRAEDIDECRRALQILKSRGDIILPGHDPEILQRYPNGVIA